MDHFLYRGMARCSPKMSPYPKIAAAGRTPFYVYSTATPFAPLQGVLI